jgi:hypothetical protein
MKNLTMSDSTVKQGCLPLLVSDCLEETAEQYAAVWQLDESKFVHGKGKHKSVQQRQCKGGVSGTDLSGPALQAGSRGGKKKNNSEKEHRPPGRSVLFSGLVLPAGSSKTI